MKVTKELALEAGRELAWFKCKETARRIIESNPGGSVGSWPGVFRKILAMLETLETGKPLEKPAFKVFAKGNSKLPFWSFSSMAILDCPGRGECSKWCYSLKSWRNPNALGRQLSNSLLLRHAAGRELIAREFAKLETETVRLYVDGDFHSKENLRWWMDLIRSRPSVAVYGYSKSWVEFLSLHLEGFTWPSNYLLNLSGGSRHPESMRVVMSGLPVTRGEFVAVQVDREHLANHSYQSRRNDGFKDYAKQVRANAGKRVFVCSGTCGDCLTVKGKNRHACGMESMRGVPIAIGMH
ncbi:MAG: hypothetical protein CMM47_01570 [Rhodospirillaceae bacterium]|nr:hypothetical protein [Rhodospirillaceae bacterium]